MRPVVATLPTYLVPPIDAVPFVAQSEGWENAFGPATERTVALGGQNNAVPDGWRAWVVDWCALIVDTAGGNNQGVRTQLRRNGVTMPAANQRPAVRAIIASDQVTLAGDTVWITAGHDCGPVLPVPLRLDAGDVLSVRWEGPGIAIATILIAWRVSGWIEPVHVDRPGLPGALPR